MPVFTCNLRNESLKIKALRRSGVAPGIIYGKNLKEPVKIEFSDTSISQLIRETSLGSQVTVIVGGVNYLTMLKKVDYVHMSNAIQHVDFQVLTTGEKN
jgi:large subunit ribosomal protein L25